MSISKVVNLPGLSKLIVKWSKGEESEPNNLKELKKIANEKYEAGLEFSKGANKPLIHHLPRMNSSNIAVILVPHPDDLDDLDKAVEDGKYKLPLEYGDMFVQPVAPKPMSGTELQKFRLFRIGDYCTTKC